MKQQSKHYYSTAQAARLLGVSIGTIQKMSERGQLQAWKTEGGHRRIALDSISQWLSRQQQSPAFGKAKSSKPKLEVTLIEADELQHKIILQALAGFNINLHIIQPHNGLDALIRLSTTMPQLLIIDLDLPLFSGQAVLNSLQQYNLLYNNHILVLSELTSSEQEKIKHDFPMIRTEPKPIDPNWLRGYLSALLDYKHLLSR